jgi:hypothetical protein
MVGRRNILEANVSVKDDTATNWLAPTQAKRSELHSGAL